jgi:predicted acetyltransferase
MTTELRELAVTDGEDIYEMLQEIGPGENGFDNRAFGISLADFPTFLKENVEMSLGIGVREKGVVPQTTYWLYADNVPVGTITLRHYLNDALRMHGGHIGFSIRPTERRKGCCTTMLALLLKEAHKKGVDDVLITTDKSNTASRKIIEKNGGKLEAQTEDYCWYWIEGVA